MVKGIVSVTRGSTKLDIKKDSPLEVNDLIETSNGSIVKMLFTNNTSILLGPNGQLRVEAYGEKKRVNIFKLIKGKIRAKVEKVSESEAKIEFKTKLASLGIRGTEFFTSSYQVLGKSVTDTILLEGELATTILGEKTFRLNATEAFNTNALKSGKGITKISPDTINS